MLLRRKIRRAARPCPHCNQSMAPEDVKCPACGRLVRLDSAIAVREEIDIVLPPAKDATRHDW
jgi:hypothetical protein